MKDDKFQKELLKDINKKLEYQKERAEKAEKKHHELKVGIFITAILAVAFGGPHLGQALQIPEEFLLIIGVLIFGGGLFLLTR